MKTNVCYFGNCLNVLPALPDNSVDSICCDPPYELGFMGKSWDNSGIAYSVPMWKECLRVLKPGGHLLSFSGTRTYHRMAVAIEDAGFEVRDMICWTYGQGFPKSLNVFKQLQKKCKCGNMNIYEERIKQMGKNREQETEYFLRFMQEADLSQTISSKKERGKVLQSCLSEQNTHKTMQGEEPKESIKNGKEPSVEGRNNLQATEGELQGSNLCEVSERVFADGEERRLHNATQISNGSTPEQVINENGSDTPQRPQSEQQQYREPCSFCKQWGTQAIRTHGVGSALKPSIEPICFSRKPLEKGLSIAENCLKWGTGGINIDESRVGTEERYNAPAGNKAGGNSLNMSAAGMPQDVDGTTAIGRFPANLIHDNSEEVRECFPDVGGGKYKAPNARVRNNGLGLGTTDNRNGLSNAPDSYGDSGNASRFFKSIIYQAKASKSERNKNTNQFLTIEICVDNTEVAQLQPKVILEKTELWFTELFGKEKMEEYQMDFKSTIKTEIKKTTILITLNYSQQLNIKEYIVGVIKTKMENGGNPAVNAVSISEWRTIIINELMAYLLGVNLVALKTQLRISVNANNFHSTVKPIALMEYLIKMITPKGGIVLDPFAGSGSTLVAARDNGFQYIGIEMTEEYLPIIKARTGCEIIHNIGKVEIPIKQAVEEKHIVIQKPKNNIDKCPKCGGRLVKTKYGLTCEDCMEDY